MITIRNLQIFLAVAETGSMSEAARQLFMAQSSISQDIAELEKQYNVRLFERTGRRLKLTSTGEAMVEYAQKSILAARETEDFLNYESKHPRIRIGATAIAGACVMSPLVARIYEEVPGIVHHVCVANAELIKEKLLNGELDLALIEGGVDGDAFTTCPVIRDELVIICSKDHHFASRSIINIRELENEPLLLSEIGSSIRSYAEQIFGETIINNNLRWGSYNFMSIIDAVQYGLGIGFATKRLVNKQIFRDAFHVCELTGVNTSFDYYLTYTKYKILPKSLLEFIRICQENNVIEKL